jgi:dTDP-glucose 4,6-dehydratase
MKILVTGGAGFIGSNFIIYMMDKYPDYKIVNLDSLTYAGNLENLKSVEKNPNYTFIHGNICDKEIVKKAMESCDMVVHFAAESHVDKSISSPTIFVETNVLGTEVLLETAKELGIKRFHHISTDEVFGTLPLDNKEQRFNENTPYSPRSPYAASKASSDHLVRAYIETYNFPATISNCTNNYGPFQFPEKIIPLFITNAFGDKALPIYGAGLAVRDYLYVADHCIAIDLILNKGKIGETYCIGGDSEKNGNQIADTVLNLLGKSQTLKTFVKDRLGHDMRYAMDHSKITRELGWQPSVTFEEGIKNTIEWYKSNKPWWKKLS